jgi:hypothetical protein
LVVKPDVLTVRYRSGVLEIAAIRHARQSDADAPADIFEAESDDLVAEPQTDDRCG